MKKKNVMSKEITVLAGPCLLQSEKDIQLAKRLKDMGADVFRAKVFVGEGTYPPQKSKFNLLDDEGYAEIFDEIASDIMPIATEANEFYFENPELFDYVWTPSRQMQNYKLLKSMNEMCEIPIILKRGFGNTIDEVIGATEYLKNIKNLYICERGVDTFDHRLDVRWRPDFLGILELKQKGFKVIFDPSHSCGRREFVLPMAKAALALGVDGLMIEVKEDPEKSWSDVKQCVSLKEFEKFMEAIR